MYTKISYTYGHLSMAMSLVLYEFLPQVIQFYPPSFTIFWESSNYIVENKFIYRNNKNTTKMKELCFFGVIYLYLAVRILDGAKSISQLPVESV